MSEPQFITSTIMIDIPEFTEKYIEGKTVTFYTVNVNDNFSKQKWTVEKRYSEFEQLHKDLVKLLPNIPPIPGKSIFKITKYDQLSKRRIQLESFLRECCKRKDISGSVFIKNFLELEKHSPDLGFNAPEKLNEWNELPLGIRDFYYYKEENIIFIVCCDMNIASRVDAYITNVNLPWEKKTDSHISVGAVFAFGLNPQNFQFEKRWAKSFPEQTGVVNYDIENCIVQVGLDSGSIHLYKTSQDSKFYQYDELICAKPHKGRVMGIAFDGSKQLIYTCSSDCKFCTVDLNNNNYVSEIAESTAGYTNLYFDKKNERVFLTNETGMVSIFLTNSTSPIIVNMVQTHTLNTIRGLEIHLFKRYLFTATNKGDISILDLGMPGKEKFIKEFSYFGGNVEIRIVRYNEENNELITGDQQGRITIWSLKRGESIYAWGAHKGAITQMNYDQSSRILMSAGKDKKILFWKLPEKWISDEVANFEKNEIKQLNAQVAMLKLQKNNNDEEDSSYDSCDGWDIRP
jgi:hypothetical protein